MYYELCTTMMDLFGLKREFLEYCELDKGQSELTIANYDRYLSKFLSWLKKQKLESGIKNQESNKKKIHNDIDNSSNVNCKLSSTLCPEDIDQEAVRQYRLYINRLKDREGKELKKTTQNYHILAVRAFLRYLAFRGIKSLSPEKISIAKTGDREITFLTNEEIKIILNAPDTKKLSGLRDRAILEILFSTGMRVSELVGLNLDNINFERGEIAVLGKGRKLRVVFLSEDAVDRLDQYLKDFGFLKSNQSAINESKDRPVFISNKKERLTVRSVERLVQSYAKKAGITKKVSPHTFRHSFATDLLMNGADVRSVQSLLGHSSITTTQVYTHVTDQHLREIHKKYHSQHQNNESGVENQGEI